MQTSSWGRAVFILPNVTPAPSRVDLPGLPPKVAAWLDQPAVSACGRCEAFQAGVCRECGLQVGSHDPACEAFMASVSPVDLAKGGPSSGWFGPEQGGTHGPGASGAEPPTLPSSATIATLEQAQAYWRGHLQGKTLPFRVQAGSRQIPIKVRFGNTDHAYTADEGGRAKTGRRIFDVKRAQAMDRILQTIEHPQRRLRNFYADLLLERRIGNEHYTIVLTWRDAHKVYEFHSAHFKSIQEVERLSRENDRRKNEGPLQKSEPGSGERGYSTEYRQMRPQALRLSSPYGAEASTRDVALGSQLTGSPLDPARGCAIILPALSDLFKACPPLERAPTLLLWRDDEPAIAALLKRMGTPTGARWITVHPNGKDGKGVPVMIQESEPGSGVYHVIGGAGGKLNYLKLRGIRPQSDYKKETTERRKIKQALDKQRRDRDRAAGLETSKKKEKDAIAAHQLQAEKTFIAEVAKTAGWTEKDQVFDDEAYAHLSPRAYQEQRQQHHRQLLKQAHAFVETQVAQALADPESLKQALGETPLVAPADPATLTVEDLDPVKPPDRGLGFAPAYGKRAAEHTEGGSAAIQAEVAEIKNQRPELQRRMIENRQKTAQALKEELQSQRLPEPPKAKTDAVPLGVLFAAGAFAGV